jgi:hypothetical protein
VLLAADLQRHELTSLSWSIGGLTLAVLFLVRPLGIWLATIGTSLSWAERFFVGWIAPRGIVAAAVAGIAGVRLQDAGYPGAGLVMPAVFAIIASTMILHGFSLIPLGRKLHLTLSNQPALAIVGASEWSTQLAQVVHEVGTPVLLVDSSARDLALAQKAGVPVLCAEVLSEEGAESLEERPADYPMQFITGWSARIWPPILATSACIRSAPALPVWTNTGASAARRGGKSLGNRAGTLPCWKLWSHRVGALWPKTSRKRTKNGF